MQAAVVLFWCCAAQGATLRYWVEPCAAAASACRAGDPELAAWAMEAWQAASGGRLTLERAGSRERAHLRVYWAAGGEGRFGETRPILVDGAPGAEVFILPTVVPPGEKDKLLRDAIVYLTCLHETGHALGLEHTANFADIMYSFQYGGDIREYFARYRRRLSSRESIRRNPGMSKGDRRRLAERYR